jgi:hypothetical protein
MVWRKGGGVEVVYQQKRNSLSREVNIAGES